MTEQMKCENCQQYFTTEDEFLSHMMNKHSSKTYMKTYKNLTHRNLGTVTYACTKCKWVSTHIDNFNEHFVKNHKEFVNESIKEINQPLPKPPKTTTVSPTPIPTTRATAKITSASLTPLNMTLMNQLPCNKCQQSPNCTKCHPDLIPEMKQKYSCDPTIWNGSAYGSYQISKNARINRGQPTPKAEILGLTPLNKMDAILKPSLVPLDTRTKSTTKLSNAPYTQQFSTLQKVDNNKQTVGRKRLNTMNNNKSEQNKKRLFECPTCNKTYTQKYNLRRHKKNNPLCQIKPKQQH